LCALFAESLSLFLFFSLFSLSLSFSLSPTTKKQNDISPLEFAHRDNAADLTFTSTTLLIGLIAVNSVRVNEKYHGAALLFGTLSRQMKFTIDDRAGPSVKE